MNDYEPFTTEECFALAAVHRGYHPDHDVKEAICDQCMASLGWLCLTCNERIADNESHSPAERCVVL